MNFITPKSTDLLLSEAETENLYLKLIEQINKDFNLANEGIDLPLSLLPNEIKLQLHEKIYRLIQYKFAEYLNLLYIIDVSEEQIKKWSKERKGIIPSLASNIKRKEKCLWSSY